MPHLRSAVLRASIIAFVVCALTITATMFICPWVTKDYVVDRARRGDLPQLAAVLKFYKEEKGTFPSEEQGLKILKGEYMRQVPKDPWGSEYVYRVKPDGHFVLYSMGKNKIDENELGDDVVIGPKAYKCEDYPINCFEPCETIRTVAFFAALISLGTIVLLTIAWVWRRVKRNAA